jgi:hypothetical protein
MKSYTLAFTLAIASIITCTKAFARDVPAITLQPIEGEVTARVVSTKNIYGSCDGEVVAVIGIAEDNFNGYRNFSIDIFANADIILRSAGKETSFKNLLDTFNAVHCVKSTTGYKLIIASHCGGSKCSDMFDFYIINPKTHKIIAPANGKTCDASCASKIIGSRAPFQINGSE